MAQQERWEDDLPLEQQVTSEKKGLPRWLLFCGCGCLLALLAVGGALGFATYYGMRLVDPEHQLPRFAKVMPFDGPLEQLEFVVHVPFGVDSYLLQDTQTDGGYVLWFTQVSDPQDANNARERALDPSNRELMGGAGRREAVQPVSILIQGREVQGVRYRVPGTRDAAQLPGGLGRAMDPAGAALTLDVTPRGNPGLVLVHFFRVEGSDEPIPEGYVHQILAPFHVGHDR
jgi:hypothetical protein